LPWTELTALRNQRSRTYQDDTHPLKKAWCGTLAALHYESELDSGVHDAEVDMTPIRIDNPAFDGWRVIANGWHHALGKDLAHHGSEDGWVGFGGRQGARWFKFRLLRTGYLHWPTREWDDLRGAPDYNRARLSQETETLTIGPNDDVINVSSLATWERLWLTPGGGQLDVRWQVNKYGLKEEIVINQAGREWIAANRPPTTPPNETYFGFVFPVDWSDIPRVYRAGLLQDIDGDFADDGEAIELRTALDKLLAFMPVSQVYVLDYELDEGETWPILRKRFWKDPDGNHYLLIGVRCDILNALPAGDLIFDPTIDEQVGATGDDGYAFGSTGYSNTQQQLRVGQVSSKIYHTWHRWTGVTIAGTVGTSYIELYGAGGAGTPLMKVAAVDEDNPAAPTDKTEFDADPLTTEQVDWDGLLTNNDWNQSPSLTNIFQELVDTYAIDNEAVMLQVNDDGCANGVVNEFDSYDKAVVGTYGAKLHIEYTEAAGGQPTQLRALTIPHMRQWQPRVAS